MNLRESRQHLILPETIETTVLRPDYDTAARDGRRRGERRSRVEVPLLLAGGGVEHVQMAIARSDVDAPARDSRRRVHARPRHELPDPFAARSVDRMDRFVASPDDDAAASGPVGTVERGRRVVGELPV